MILNSNKTNALVVSRSMTVNPPHGGLVSCLGSPFRLSQPQHFWCEV